MTYRVQRLGHEATQANAFTGLVRELTIDISNWNIRLHDGATEGGHIIPNLEYISQNFHAVDATELNADVISESTLGHGVEVDGVLMKDGTIDGIVMDDFHDDFTGLVTAFNAHVADVTNPHEVTATQVGLGNVTNTAQLAIAQNLHDLADTAVARTNLGLGTAATLNAGTDEDNVPVLGPGGILPGAYGAVPTGAIIEWDEDALPSDDESWVWADGSAISRITYARLFARWGTKYGAGDGSTTFNVKNKCGRVSIGAGTTKQLDAFDHTAVNTSTNAITFAFNAHTWFTGAPVQLTTTGGLPAGLAGLTTYYLIVATDRATFTLATTEANAVAGTAIDITTQGTGVHTMTLQGETFALDEQGGEMRHLNTVDELPAHVHSQSKYNVQAAYGGGIGGARFAEDVEPTGSTGGSKSALRIPAYDVCKYIIKT